MFGYLKKRSVPCQVLALGDSDVAKILVEEWLCYWAPGKRDDQLNVPQVQKVGEVYVVFGFVRESWFWITVHACISWKIHSSFNICFLSLPKKLLTSWVRITIQKILTSQVSNKEKKRARSASDKYNIRSKSV
jgi:hypothetical protein